MTAETRQQRYADLRDMDTPKLKTLCDGYKIDYVNKRHAVEAVISHEHPTSTERLTEPSPQGPSDHFRERRPRRL
jgi:hypothetical protein